MSPVATLDRSARDRRIAESSPSDELEPILVRPLSREMPRPSARSQERVSRFQRRPDLEEGAAEELIARAWPALDPGNSQSPTDDLDFDPVLVQPLRQAVPKKKASKRRSRFQTRPQVVRLAAMIVGGAATLALTVHLASLAAAPVVATHRTGMEIQAAEKQLADARLQNESLRAEIGLLDTRVGQEQEARRRGWAMEGEVAVGLVFPDGETAKVASKPEASASDQKLSVADRIRKGVEATLAVLGGNSPGAR